jgi:histidine triad (HIT) family protein
MQRDPNCIFCKIVAGEIPCFKLFEDEATLAFMDINPVQPGHALIVPKDHSADLYTIDDEALAATARTARRVAAAVQAAIAPEGLNLLQCNGKAAQQSVFHFHMHVIPRAMGDDLTMNWEITPGDMAAIGELAEKIKAEIA